MAVGQDAAGLQQIIQDLADFAKCHCPTEEQLMESHGYPLREMHIMEHQKFLARLSEIERVAAEGHPAAALQMLSRLRGWLDSHMAEWDAKLGQFLNSHGVE